MSERYSVEITFTADAVEGSIWRVEEEYPDGSRLLEEVADFSDASTLTGALTAAGRIIALDRGGPAKRVPLTHRDVGDESDAREKGGG